MNDLFNYLECDSNITINVCRSAPNQIQPLHNIQQICQYWDSKGHKEILDVGCGYLRNSLFLINYFSLYVCDFPQITESQLFKTRFELLVRNKNFRQLLPPKNLKHGRLKVDGAFISFVLHTIPENETRIKLIENVKKNLKYPFEIFIATPIGEKYYRNQRKPKNSFGDGFLLDYGDGQKSFYKEFNASQIDEFMFELGFKVDKIFFVDKKRMRFYQTVE
ncbi:MAG: class I SAM-dependent methyltransferase [Methanoregula sp.]